MQGRADTTRLLLESGADIETKGTSGATPLYVACAFGRHLTARLLLDSGADLEAKTTSGLTPLLIAVFNAQAEAVKLLLEHGADAEATSNAGRGVWSRCDDADCKQLLERAESIQRWHRRRGLALWGSV